MDKLEFIYKRHSVRKFKNKEVPNEDIKKIIKAATYAPSGKNVQNWHFVIVKNKEKIQQMAEIVEAKNEELANKCTDKEKANKFRKFVKYHTVFKNAPVVILVYAGPYPPTGLDILKNAGATTEEINSLLKTASGIQNIAAAMENLQLAAANIGYGTCWITGPMYAKKEINESLNFNKKEYHIAAITSLGIPEKSELKSPPRKPVEEVMTIIE